MTWWTMGGGVDGGAVDGDAEEHDDKQDDCDDDGDGEMSAVTADGVGEQFVDVDEQSSVGLDDASDVGERGSTGNTEDGVFDRTADKGDDLRDVDEALNAHSSAPPSLSLPSPPARPLPFRLSRGNDSVPNVLLLIGGQLVILTVGC